MPDVFPSLLLLVWLICGRFSISSARVIAVGYFIVVAICFFFFSSRRRHTRCSRDWSSDVCSSDLWILLVAHAGEDPAAMLDGLPGEETIAGLVLVAERAASERKREDDGTREKERREPESGAARGLRCRQMTPACWARSAIFCARVRWGWSIIWPFQAKAPAPLRACSSQAAMRASASSASALEGVNSWLITSTWLGWIDSFPLKPMATPSLHSRRSPSRSGISV